MIKKFIDKLLAKATPGGRKAAAAPFGKREEVPASVHGTVVHPLGVNTVDGGRHLLALAKRRGTGAAPSRGGFGDEFVDEFLDHGVAENRSRMRQPRCTASSRRRASGLVATGVLTFSSRGMSLVESL